MIGYEKEAKITLKDEPDYLEVCQDTFHITDKEDKLKEKLKLLEEKNLKDR